MHLSSRFAPRRRALVALVACASGLAACAGSGSDAGDAPPADAWDTPGAADAAPRWTTTAYFAPGDDADDASADFTGRVAFSTTPLTVKADPADAFVSTPWAWWGLFDFLTAQDPPGAVPVMELDAGLFPGLAVDFFTDDGALVPVERDIIRLPLKDRTKSFWELIVAPGRTWAADVRDGEWADWDKAAFPFSLVQSQEGEAWIGLGSFYYKDGQVSNARVQLSSVAGGGFIFWDPDFDVTAWGEIPVTFSADAIGDLDAARTAWDAERKGRLDTAPLADLDPEVAAAVAALDPKLTLAAAVLSGDTLYMDPVVTPFGEYPYATDMRVGVWSATKSLIPGMAALRLAEKYGPEFLDTKLVDYVEEGKEFRYVGLKSADRWAQVSIRDALHMRTGMGPSGYDPNWATSNANTYRWGYSYTLRDMIPYYFAQTPNPEVKGPGEKFFYMDQDMWAASLAMDRYLKAKEGPSASLMQMLRDEVYGPLGTQHFALGTTYTPDGSPGFTYGAWGALPTIELLAKAGRLVASGGAAPDGTQLLNREILDTFGQSEDYQFAFWKTTVEAGGTTYQLPTMSGAGGNKVYALPNGASLVILGRDNYNGSVDDKAAERILVALLGLAGS